MGHPGRARVHQEHQPAPEVSQQLFHAVAARLGARQGRSRGAGPPAGRPPPGSRPARRSRPSSPRPRASTSPLSVAPTSASKRTSRFEAYRELYDFDPPPPPRPSPSRTSPTATCAPSRPPCCPRYRQRRQRRQPIRPDGARRALIALPIAPLIRAADRPARWLPAVPSSAPMTEICDGRTSGRQFDPATRRRSWRPPAVSGPSSSRRSTSRSS